MTGRLLGKRVIITGAAGGIGSAAARGFVREGAIVGLIDRSGERLDALAAELGDTAVALPCDIAEESSLRRALSIWSAAQPALDVVYVCAGVQNHDDDGPVTDVTLDTWRSTFAVNAEGVFLTLKYSVPLLVNSGGGSVIICGSPTALTMSGRGYSAYSASKAAAMAICRVVAADYAHLGVRANVIVPGPTETPFIQTLLMDDQTRRGLEASVPLGRIGAAEDLVGIATFLASDESSYATGAVFAVDGGVTHR